MSGFSGPQVRIKFELTNQGKQNKTYYRQDFVLEDKNGRMYKPVTEDPGRWELNPLQKDYPQIVYNIPAGLESYEFNFGYKEESGEMAYRISFNPYDTRFMINHIINITYNRLSNGIDRDIYNKWQMDGYEFSNLSTTTSLLLIRDRAKIRRELLNYMHNVNSQSINATTFTQYKVYNDNNKSEVLKGSIEFLKSFEESLKQMNFVSDKADDRDNAYQQKYVKKDKDKNIICDVFITDQAKEANTKIYTSTISFRLE